MVPMAKGKLTMSKRFVCPHCKSQEDEVVQVGTVSATWDGEFDDETGEWIEGGTEETQDADVDGFWCRGCDKFFGEPFDLQKGE
jgi:hypothetical protein